MKYFALLLVLLAPTIALAQGFVPLTGIPGIGTLNGVDASTSLPDFFNILYKLCIGAAAVIAVFQIMYAGFQSITQEGSVIEKGKVRDRIKNSILGLLLVLSPAIVFGVIDPRILNLDIASLDSLQLTGRATSGGGLSQLEREAIATGVTDAAAACGVTLTQEQSSCLANTPTNSGCLPEMTNEQRSCLGQRLGSIANMCRALNVRENTVVQPEFRACCAEAGLVARQVGRTSSYTCMAPDAGENSSGITFETTAGYYNYVVYEPTEDTSQCTQLTQGSFETAEACTASYNEQTAGDAHLPLLNCRQVTGTSFNSTIQFNGEGACPAVIKLP